jgi:siderophore synthetase component
VLLVSERGLLPELHGQNSLAEIDSMLKLRRIVHRDFQGIYSDSRIRVAKGLPVFTKHVAGTEEGTTIQSQYSNVFDGMIGRYLLERLTKTFCRYFGVRYNKVTQAIAAYHRSLPSWDAADWQ